MTSRFRLSVERAPGSLERVLAVARRRRLGLESVSVTAADAERWDVAIVAGVPSGEGSLTLRNFAALVNVRHAAFDESMTSEGERATASPARANTTSLERGISAKPSA